MTLVASPLDTVGGLPVHALVVHAVVVLLPLAAVGAVCVVAVPSWSKRFGVLVVIAAGLAGGATVLAKESGEQLASRVGSPQPHVDLGDAMAPIALGFLVLVTVFWLFDRGIPGGRARPLWLKVLAAAVVAAALFATFWVVRVGHTGAEAVWSEVMGSTTSRAVPVGG